MTAVQLAETTSPLVELRGVGLEVLRPVRTRILYPLDLTLASRRSLAIMGPSGAGKTSLASIIGALQPPSQGVVSFAGRDLVGWSHRKLAAFRRDHVGFVFQQSLLIDERSARANVELGLVDSVLSARDRREAAVAALDLVGLAELADRRAAHLSGGERHRVAVARALVKQPRLVIADEPTAALDQETGHSVLELLARAPEVGATLIVVTHDERVKGFVDDVVHIVDGRRV